MPKSGGYTQAVEETPLDEVVKQLTEARAELAALKAKHQRPVQRPAGIDFERVIKASMTALMDELRPIIKRLQDRVEELERR